MVVGHELPVVARETRLPESAEPSVELGRRDAERALDHVFGALALAPQPEHLGDLGHAERLRQVDLNLARRVVGGHHVARVVGVGEGVVNMSTGGTRLPSSAT